ncbi:phosphoethanolamine--lipid A transferase [Psychrobacter sanguinis]|uniref:Phosphoethanolamine--lipid A transferase n=2 Tax=Psychrobacter sanguinis TaxID=861445 RepID=A0A844M403_9GAMM|nr:phosphoethanolamine--lipid A transferase [Psychrobacter sanguinis]
MFFPTRSLHMVNQTSSSVDTAPLSQPTNFASSQQGSVDKRSYLKLFSQRPINANILVFIVALYLTLTANFSFFNQLTAIYPVTHSLAFVMSVGGLLFCVIWLVLQLVSHKYLHKPMLILALMIGAICAYFTDSYGTIFDTHMLINGLETDQAEAMDLFAPAFLMRVVVLGVIPALLVSQLRIKTVPLKFAALQKIGAIIATLALMAACLLPFGDQYASFFRQHKQVRFYANPVMPIYSSIKLGTDKFDEIRRPKTLTAHATDAKHIAPASTKPKLMVLVVGETVRADHIGLNGYARNTMPLLSNTKDIYSFKDVSSCGTSTAYSVPCMFSYLGRDKFDVDMASYNENVLDTLHKQGVNVIWRDNNSSSKGVADRVTFEDYKTQATNLECDVECRDIGMLKDFDKLVMGPKNSPPKDTLVVLHQMGNHGPAYYKRYPKAFEVFKPTCLSNELSKCDTQSVINAYDNAIVYTDYFLHNIIDTLKPYEQAYDVVMVYLSDHGESLGENNIYLHGLPYKIAPKAQKQVPVIVWSPASNHMDSQAIASQLTAPASQDYLAPSLLQYFNISTQEADHKPTFFQAQR